MDKKVVHELPENAYRELKPGEEYKPVLPADKMFPEVTGWSIFWGLLMAIIFSGASAYSGLKIGQVIEAAIPISIVAVGVGNLAKKSKVLGQNVIIQSIGASSGVIVAGAIFTIPGLYILKLDANFFHIFLSAMIGGFFGILFLIPFRKYFVKEKHGYFPFPEATATTEILISGEKGGKQAGILVKSAIIGGIYDFIAIYFEVWREIFTSRVIPAGEAIADKTKMLFQLNVSSLIIGFGYLVGLKFSSIIAIGSLLAWFVFIPLLNYVGELAAGPGGVNMFASMAPEIIFKEYVRHIGIGAIAMAGLIGIIKSSKVIYSAVGLAVKGLFGKDTGASEVVPRTQKDIKMNFVAILIILNAILFFIFLYTAFDLTLGQSIAAFFTVFIISFLFTTVAAEAIAIVGSNPVSGMTLMTLILSSFILAGLGLEGDSGMLSALVIGGVVCTALSMAGGFITDLKIGYWLGSTPIKQESYKFLGTIVSAATVGLVIFMLNNTFGFTNEDYALNQFDEKEKTMIIEGSASDEIMEEYNQHLETAKPLVAPQANAMVAVVQPFFSDQEGQSKMMLLAIGAIIAVLLNWLGISPLAFALGMYLPLHLNTPLIIGGLINHFVNKNDNKKLANARNQRGTLIASGFIAGAAIFGILGAILIFFGANLDFGLWNHEDKTPELLALVAFALLVLYFIWDVRKAKIED